MKMMKMSALAAAATVLAHPFRRNSAALTLAAPTLALPAPAGALSLPAPIAMPRAITGMRLRADGADPKALVEQIGAAVKEMRETNDRELSALKAKVDPLSVEKFDKISAAVDKLQDAMQEQATTIAALKLNGGESPDLQPTNPAYAKAFRAHMRRGDQAGAEVMAAMTEGSATDGGYTAPIEWDRTITNKLKLISPIRQNALVQDTSTAGFKKLFNDRTIGSGWVGETASRPSTSTPQIGALDFTTGELYANPAISQVLLDDSAVDLEKWLAGEVDTEFSRQEGIAFLAGDGANKPFGLLTYVDGAANAAKHPWGSIGADTSGNATQLTGDGFITFMYNLPGAFAQNGKLYMNRLSLGAARKLKDGQGNYLWQPTYVAGQPQTLNGAPIVELPGMPTVAAGNVVALYGDMEATYMIVDRVGIRVLRDPFTDKPFVHFYTTKRVGGGVYNPQPMRALKIGA
jgi:HK97 family phage major capsid protein